MEYTVHRLPDSTKWEVRKDGSRVTVENSECTARIFVYDKTNDTKNFSFWYRIWRKRMKLRKEIAAIEYERGIGNGLYMVE